jgi:hypothetical protein
LHNHGFTASKRTVKDNWFKDAFENVLITSNKAGAVVKINSSKAIAPESGDGISNTKKMIGNFDGSRQTEQKT